jgi:hypothetical protein
LSGYNPVAELIASSRCEICGKAYEESEITIFGHKDDIWVLRVFCEACSTESMLAALIRNNPTE